MIASIPEHKLGTQFERLNSGTILTHLPGPGRKPFHSLDHYKVARVDRYSIFGILFYGARLNTKSVMIDVGSVCLPIENHSPLLAELNVMGYLVRDLKIVLLRDIVRVVVEARKFPTIGQLYSNSVQLRDHITEYK